MLKKFSKAILVIALGVHLSGCVLLLGAAAGASGVVWAKGRLRQELKQSLVQTYTATISGLKKMDLPIILERKDALTGRIESKFADGTNVWIDIEHLAENSSRLTIRVGVLGDHERSDKIMESVRSYL